jgi:hypothetical protein
MIMTIDFISPDRQPAIFWRCTRHRSLADTRELSELPQGMSTLTLWAPTFVSKKLNKINQMRLATGLRKSRCKERLEAATHEDAPDFPYVSSRFGFCGGRPSGGQGGLRKIL